VRVRSIQILVVLLTATIAATASVSAQTEAEQPPAHEHDHHAIADPEAWSWSTDANFFFGYNYQQRKFADFWAWESQNWIMASGERTVGGGRLTLMGMFSLEPWTIGRLVYAHGLNGPERVYAFDNTGAQQPLGGSPQAFQTGESYLGSPLINIQHPHDAVMALGATYRFEAGGAKYTFGADLVGEPALGPTPFMHRQSAQNNPTAPLTHHYMDSTHVSFDVLRSGVALGPVSLEASAFRGEEPDENRTNIDVRPFCDPDAPENIGCKGPRLDSWSSRVSWHRGPWAAQFSGGRLHKPEWFEPTDVTRLTASVSFTGDVASRPLAATVAWGQNRELTFALDGYLAEWDYQLTGSNTIYGRAESVLKEIFGLGVHPAGLLNHPRNFSSINALTIGYVRDLPLPGPNRFGIGADVTVHDTSQDLVDYYGSARSYHVFLRWRPNAVAPAHVH
jgi:hypothetical protein